MNHANLEKVWNIFSKNTMPCSAALPLEESYSSNLKTIFITKLLYYRWLCYLHFTVLRLIQINGKSKYLFIWLQFAPSAQPLISQLSAPRKKGSAISVLNNNSVSQAHRFPILQAANWLKINFYKNVTKNIKFFYVQYFVTFS